MPDDLLSDKHIHTSWTDGSSSITEIIAEAERLHLDHIAITEHVRADSVYFDSFLADLAKCSSASKIRVLGGFEAKITSDGSLDLPSAVSAKVPVRIASVHRLPVNGRLALPSELTASECQGEELALCLAAIAHGEGNILGHPGGMSLKHHHAFPLTYFEKIIAACAKNNFIFEVNGTYHLSVLNELKPLLQRYNPFISFGSDSHAPGDLTTFANTIRKWAK